MSNVEEQALRGLAQLTFDLFSLPEVLVRIEQRFGPKSREEGVARAIWFELEHKYRPQRRPTPPTREGAANREGR